MADSKLAHIQFWCQKVLPTVYDDSLSYYELLCKIVQQVNSIIDAINGGTSVEIDIEQALRDMVADGTLTPILESSIDEIVDPQISALEQELNTQVTTLTNLVNQAAAANAMKGMTNYINVSQASLNPNNNRKTWLFVGDSWANSGGDGSQGLSHAFAERMGCNVLKIAHDGYGFYVTPTIQSLWSQWSSNNTTYNWNNVGGVFVIGGVNDVRNGDVTQSNGGQWVLAIETLCNQIADYFDNRVPVYFCADMKSQTTPEWRALYSYLFYRITTINYRFMVIQPFTYWLYTNIATNYVGRSGSSSDNLAGLHPSEQGYRALANLLYMVVNGCPLSAYYRIQDTSFLQNVAGAQITMSDLGDWCMDSDGQVYGTNITGTAAGNQSQYAAALAFTHGGAFMAGSASGLVVDGSTSQPKEDFVVTSTNVYFYSRQSVAATSELQCNNARAIFLGYIAD